MTPEQRSAIENAIWLCQNCAKLVDNDTQAYSRGILTRWRTLAERAAKVELEGGSTPSSAESRCAILKVVLPIPPGTNLSGPTKYQLFLLNDGEHAEVGYWYLGIPKQMRNRVAVKPSSGNEETLIPADNWHVASAFDQPLVSCFSDDFFLMKFKISTLVEPSEMAPCAELSVEWQDEARNQSRRIFLWFTRNVSGRFPDRGMKKLRLYSATDAVFKAQYGGIVLPPDDSDDFS